METLSHIPDEMVDSIIVERKQTPDDVETPAKDEAISNSGGAKLVKNESRSALSILEDATSAFDAYLEKK